MTYWVAGAAAVGALMDRKKPLRGALIGAGTAMTGGALAGGAAAGGAGAAGAASGAGAAGAASAGAGTAGAAGAGAGGLLGTSAAAGTTAATTAGTSAAGGSMSGGLLSASGGQAAAPIVDLSVKATPEMLQGLSTTAGQSGGLMGTIKPVGEAMAATQTAQGLLAPNESSPAPPPVQTQPLDLSGVLNTNQQEQARQLEEDMRRRQSLSDFAAYAMKGGR